MTRPSAKKSFTKTAEKPPVLRRYPYPSLGGPKMTADVAALDGDIDAFVKKYHGNVASLTPPGMLKGLRALEGLYERLYRIELSLDLRRALGTGAPAKAAEIGAWHAAAATKIGFFEGQIGDMPPSRFRKLAAAPELADYALRLRRRYKEHRHMLFEKDTAAFDAERAEKIEPLQKLYHRKMDHIRLRLDGRSVPFLTAAAAAGDEGRTPAERRKIGASLERALKSRARTIAHIYNTIAADTLKWTRKHKYRRPEEYFGHGLRPRVLDMMAEMVNGAAPRLSQRFQSLQKAHPLEQGEPRYGWREARLNGIAAGRAFSRAYGRMVKAGFDGGHIDARPRRGKTPEGFTMPAGRAGEAPYSISNFDGSPEELFSGLSHENVGHVPHFTALQRKRSFFLRETPPEIEETAAFFGELLAADMAIRREKDEGKKDWLREDRLERMLGNGPRQIALYTFERQAHEELRKKKRPLTTRRLCALWSQAEKRVQAPGGKLAAHEKYGWMQDPHFIDTPFRTSAYGFAMFGALALYRRYQQAAARGEKARARFAKKYVGQFLGAGATKTLAGHLRPFGLDPSRPAFYAEGIALLEAEIKARENAAARRAEQAPRP